MTGHDDEPESDARRSFMKKGALATGALALGSAGTAAAQDDDDGILADEAGGKALITVDNFHPRGRFVFVSGVLDWNPSIPDVDDSIWSQYNTYQIRWLGTNEIVPLWVAQDAEVGEYDSDEGFIPDLDDDEGEPQAWEMNQQWTPLGDNDAMITVQFEPVDEEQEDAILDNDQWWGDLGDDDAGTPDSGGGAAGNDTDGIGNPTDDEFFDGNDSGV